jgi:ketopantoate reductase
MNVLVVGAGATGQVLGLFLQRGGARLSFYVRPKYADEVRAGLSVTGRGGPFDHEELPLHPEAVLTTPAEAAGQRYDAVFVCLSSTGLRAGRWLADLTATLGPTVPFVFLSPGIEDRDFVASAAPGTPIVWLMFPMIAYTVADVEPSSSTATAVWRPPLARVPLGGDPAHTEPLAEVLDRGGLPTRTVSLEALTRDLAFSGAVLNLHMVGLEIAGWSFAALRDDRELMALVYAALGEALALSAHRVGTAPPLPLRLLRPWLSRVALRLAPRFIPLPAETYFRVHFTKVGDQTAQQLVAYAEAADAAGLSSTQLRALAARHRQAHAGDAAA